MIDSASAPARNQWPLGDIPQGWAPEEIRCGLLDYEWGTAGVEFLFRPWSTGELIKVWDAEFGLEKALAQVRAEERSLPVIRSETPFDLRIEKPCWIILKLLKRPWRFRKTGYPVTTKSNREKNYAGLTYVNDSGDFYSGDQDVEEACRIVFFSAVQPPRSDEETLPYAHGVNFHIDLLQNGKKRLPLVFDPDIKYPGGNT
jgi:hypothetical protein